MNCCLTDPIDTEADAFNQGNATTHQDDAARACMSCGSASRPVSRRTVLLMVRPEMLESVGEADYRFCADANCPVVYFTETEGPCFTVEDLRLRVGLKEKEDPIPLCYCFGFDEQHAREEIARTNQCSIPQRISALIKQGLCACEERNPSGACCLGEVNRAVKLLMARMVESS